MRTPLDRSHVQRDIDGGRMTSSAKIPIGAPRLPRKFGPYLLFDQIGKGGMAEIFLARAQTELGGSRLCVVKQIIPSFSAHKRFSEMLIHEAKLAARLDHANIVKVFDLGRADDELYIAMEYIEGFDLTELLQRCTKSKIAMPLEFALGVVCSTLRGLDYAHRRTSDAGEPLGIVHRDVSPSNVLISFEGEVKLCDFGIAHANQLVKDENPALLANESLQGKAGYMSPEHARGEGVDARSDVFGAGVLLWELLNGRRMYKKDATASLLEQARAADIPPLSTRGIADEKTVQGIAIRALAREKDARYPSAAAMLRDLEGYMGGAKLVASSLKLGTWLESSFGTEIVTRRRMRQRAAEALEKGPPVVLTPIDLPAPLPSVPDSLATVTAGVAVGVAVGVAAESSSPSSIDAATVDLASSRPDVVAASLEVPPARGGLAWVAIVVAIASLAIAFAYAYMAHAR
jgi:eukaryotic-like serine/threonine-protein kinase